MANQEHLEILKQGVEVWNKWRVEHPEIQPDLRGADLRKTKLAGIDLRRADLSLGVLVLPHPKLSGSLTPILASTNLLGSDLSDADLSYANLSNAYLDRADFRRLLLIGTPCR